MIDHPFINLLGGHPQAISLAAPLLNFKSLKELFQDFLKNDFKALESGDVAAATTNSLEASMNVSIESLQREDPDSLQLFKFISLLPAGTSLLDLSQMLAEYAHLIEHKDMLI